MRATSGCPAAALFVAVLQVSNRNRWTRPHFKWANALLIVAVEQLLGCDCDSLPNK
jgi:hypothetical protein